MRASVYESTDTLRERLRRLILGEVDGCRSVDRFSHALSALGEIGHEERVPGMADRFDAPRIRIVSDDEAAIARRIQRRRATARSRRRGRGRRAPVHRNVEVPSISIPSRALTARNGHGVMRLPGPADLAEAGRRLREARQLRGLSLDDVHRDLRIPLLVLEALEEGRTDQPLAPVYIRGFLRRYSHAVDVDLDHMLEGGTNEVRAPERARPSRRRAERRRAVAAAAIVVVLAAGIAAAAGSDAARVSEQAGPAERPRASSHVSDVVTSVVEPLTSGRTTTTRATSIRPVSLEDSTVRYIVGSGGVRLTLAATGECWRRVTASGSTLYEGILHAGQHHTLVASPPIGIRLGDGAAMSIRAGDRPLTVAGVEGRPIDLELSA